MLILGLLLKNAEKFLTVYSFQSERKAYQTKE